MPITTNSDVHVVDQVGDVAIQEAWENNSLLMAPGVVSDISGRIDFAGGDTVEIPFWSTDTTGFVQDLPRNTRVGVPPTKVSMDKITETAYSKIISIDYDEYTREDASADLAAYIAKKTGELFGSWLQGVLIEKTEALNTTPDVNYPLLKHTTPVGGLTVDQILEARMKFGDSAGALSPVYLLANTTAAFNLMKTSDYKTLASSANQSIAGQSSDWSSRVISVIHGVNVVLMDKLPAGVAYLVGPHTFGVWINDNPKTTIHGHAGSNVRTWDTTFRAAATVLPHTPRRIVRVTVTP